MATALSDLRTLLANLAGEDSAPVSASRDVFINETIKDIYRRMQWPFRRKSAVLSFSSSGVATAPADYSYGDGFYDLRISKERIFHLIDENMQGNYSARDNVVWVTGNDVDGYAFNTLETDSPAPVLVYFASSVSLSASGSTTPIPNPLAIAYGALVMLKQFNDPDIDVSPEIANYEREIAKMRAQSFRTTSQRLVGPMEAFGTSYGEVN